MAFKCPKTAGLYCHEDDNEPEQQAECTDVYRRGSVNDVAVEDIILEQLGHWYGRTSSHKVTLRMVRSLYGVLMVTVSLTL